MIYLYILILVMLILVLLILFAGIRILRPAKRGHMERLGKFDNQVFPGLHWIILIAEPRKIITNDNLNANVDSKGFFRTELKQIDPSRDVQANMNKMVADKYILENAQLLRKLEALEASLRAERLKSFGLN